MSDTSLQSMAQDIMQCQQVEAELDAVTQECQQMDAEIQQLEARLIEMKNKRLIRENDRKALYMQWETLDQKIVGIMEAFLQKRYERKQKIKQLPLPPASPNMTMPTPMQPMHTSQEAAYPTGAAPPGWPSYPMPTSPNNGPPSHPPFVTTETPHYQTTAGPPMQGPPYHEQKQPAPPQPTDKTQQTPQAPVHSHEQVQTSEPQQTGGTPLQEAVGGNPAFPGWEERKWSIT